MTQTMLKHRPCSEQTKIIYDRDTDRFICVKCRHIFNYSFGFSRCPYCGRPVIESDKRR